MCELRRAAGCIERDPLYKHGMSRDGAEFFRACNERVRARGSRLKTPSSTAMREEIVGRVARSSPCSRMAVSRDPAKARTCFWTRGLPSRYRPTSDSDRRTTRLRNIHLIRTVYTGLDRWSQTRTRRPAYLGIARAIADQWARRTHPPMRRFAGPVTCWTACGVGGYLLLAVEAGRVRG
jgi:hypothetical protein